MRREMIVIGGPRSIDNTHPCCISLAPAFFLEKEFVLGLRYTVTVGRHECSDATSSLLLKGAENYQLPCSVGLIVNARAKPAAAQSMFHIYRSEHVEGQDVASDDACGRYPASCGLT
jgi:hypothetical protein